MSELLHRFAGRALGLVERSGAAEGRPGEAGVEGAASVVLLPANAPAVPPSMEVSNSGANRLRMPSAVSSEFGPSRIARDSSGVK